MPIAVAEIPPVITCRRLIIALPPIACEACDYAVAPLMRKLGRKFGFYRCGALRIRTHGHGNAAMIVENLVDHFGMAMQPADAGAVGWIEIELDQHAAGTEPLLNRRIKDV